VSLFVGALGALTTEYLQFGKFYEIKSSAFLSPRKDTSYEAAGTAKLEKCLGPVHEPHVHVHVSHVSRKIPVCAALTSERLKRMEKTHHETTIDIGRPESRRLYHLDGDDDDCCQREGGEHVLQHVELRELLRESCLTGGHQHRDGGLCGRHRGLYVQHH